MPVRRRFVVLSLTAVLLAATGACGDDESPAPAASEADAAAEGTFPATVRHKYGTTTVERAPKRVVVVGLREQDPLLALGVVPVATKEWYGEDPGALEPWAREKLGDAPLPTVLPSSETTDVEKTAAQRPDLIIGVDSAMTEQEYEQLSQLAPTVAPPADTIDWGTSWQQQLHMVGDALGRRDEAERLQDEVEGRIRAVAEEHPDWRGKEALNATVDAGQFYVYGPETANSRLLAQLGFAFPAALEDIGGEDGFGGALSEERAELLDIDMVMWDYAADPDRKAIEDKPVLARLGIQREGREVFLQQGSDAYDALSKTSVLSVPVALDLLAPRFDAALDGDPSTPTD